MVKKSALEEAVFKFSALTQTLSKFVCLTDFFFVVYLPVDILVGSI